VIGGVIRNEAVPAAAVAVDQVHQFREVRLAAWPEPLEYRLEHVG
jgi:hypothetical protein